MWNVAVLGILSLAFIGMICVMFPIIVFAKVEQQKKLEAEMEQLRREQRGSAEADGAGQDGGAPR